MYDRVSQNPGRVLITPEDGSGAFYATLALADNPTVVGTPLNSATLLSQATAALYGLGADAVPDDVMKKARSLITTAQNTASDKSKVVVGQYAGVDVNEYGGSITPVSLSFSGTPIGVFILMRTAGKVSLPSCFIRPCKIGFVGFSAFYDSSSGSQQLNVSASPVTWGGSSVTITATDVRFSLNLSGNTYYYIAFLE